MGLFGNKQPASPPAEPRIDPRRVELSRSLGRFSVTASVDEYGKAAVRIYDASNIYGGSLHGVSAQDLYSLAKHAEELESACRETLARLEAKP